MTGINREFKVLIGGSGVAHGVILHVQEDREQEAGAFAQRGSSV